MSIENRDPLSNQPELGTIGAVIDQFDKIVDGAMRDNRKEDQELYLHASGLLKTLMEKNQITSDASAEEMIKVVEDYESKLGKADGKLKDVAFLILGQLRGMASIGKSEK